MPSIRRQTLCLLTLSLALSLALLRPTLAAPLASLREAETFDFARQSIEPAQLDIWPLRDLRMLRGIVFGRHGRVFKEKDIQEWLQNENWYKPRAGYSNAQLNDTERRNLDIIRGAEASRHSHIEPGDWRYYANRAVTPAQLGQHTIADWRIMRGEIEANHGKRFDDEPWLQNYFNERYWYRPAAKYDPSKLSAAERKNIALLLDQEKKLRGVRLAPGDLRAYQNRPISDAMLNGLGLYELRLLRNEIFALRGQRFRTDWIREHFEEQPWYQPRADDSEPTLSATEEANLRVILARETKLHESLSHQAVTPQLIHGLFLEDARKLRNEIYARHGRVFKNRWLQDYFSSQSWYRPNPGFRESQLNKLETRNAVTILAYERKLQSQMDMTEG